MANTCTQGPGAHFSAQVQGLGLVLGQGNRAQILARVLKKRWFTLVPSDYRTRAPVPGNQV